jgi:hypothetical protein
MKKNTFLLLLTLSLWRLPIQAQEARGTLTGRVTDANNATIVNAKVTATSAATGVSLNAVTNSDGQFELPYLLPGEYRVTIESAGFKQAQFASVLLLVNERKFLNVALAPGEVSDSVNVTAEAPLIDTSTASTGLVIDGKRVRELPMVGGNAFMLARMAPGVTTTGGRTAGNPYDFGAATDNIAVNGTRTRQSEISLDGSPNVVERSGGYSPPQDLVAEFKIQTATYDASLGHAPGALTNVSIKSGTKDLHGTAYFNDSRIRAVPWHTNRFLYDPATGPINQEKIDRNVPSWLHQRWGATATGPVMIPKIYRGKERTFWSFGYERVHVNRPQPLTTTVPTEAQRRGDFSALLGANLCTNAAGQVSPCGGAFTTPLNVTDTRGRTLQAREGMIYDPATIRAATGGRFTRQAFADNLIPTNRLDPVAQKMLTFMPLPNQPGTVREQRNNYFRTYDIERFNDSLLTRIDHIFSQNNRAFFRYNYNNYKLDALPLGTIANGQNEAQTGHGVVIDNVHTFSPRVVFNVRYGLTYQRPRAEANSLGFDITSLGISQNVVDEINRKSLPRGIAFPEVSIDNFQGLGTGGGNGRALAYHNFNSTLSWFAGKHSWRFGAEMRSQRENGYAYGSVAPLYQFASLWTRGPIDNSAAFFGQSLGSFLLGLPTGGSAAINSTRAQQSIYQGYYAQDDWRITKKFGVNLGLRYEYDGPPTERYNRSLRGFDFTTANPISAAALANYTRSPIPEVPVSSFRSLGGLTFAGVNGQPRELWNADKNNFAPRVGLVYAFTNKFVLRAGFGIFYNTYGVDQFDVNQNGFSRSTSIVPTTNNGQTFVATLQNPLPNGLLLPAGAGDGLKTGLGRGVSYFAENPVNPYFARWSMSLQRELPGRIVVDATYAGTRGNKQNSTRNLNAVPGRYFSTLTTRDNAVNNFLNAAVPNPFANLPEFAGSALATANVSRAQLLRPYPHFQDITVTEQFGYSWYHSAQLSIEKRLTRGFTLQGSYTFSKLMQATELLNAFDLKPAEVISDLDVPHRLVINGIWELPFGKKSKFLSKMNWFGDLTLGGWQLVGIFEGQSGNPLGFGNAIVRGDLRTLVLPRSQRTSERWLNVEAANQVFDRLQANQLVSNVRTLPLRFGFIRSDGINNFDLSLFKNVQLTEKVRVQFRFEAFNAFNHVAIAGPNTSVTSDAFGSINSETGHGPRQITMGLKLIF